VPFRSQRFDPDLPNAAAFTSGERSLDVWLREQAVAATDRRTARTWVWVSDADAVVGNYALTAHKIARDDVPARIGREGRRKSRRCSSPGSPCTSTCADRTSAGGRVPRAV